MEFYRKRNPIKKIQKNQLNNKYYFALSLRFHQPLIELILLQISQVFFAFYTSEDFVTIIAEMKIYSRNEDNYQ